MHPFYRKIKYEEVVNMINENGIIGMILFGGVLLYILFYIINIMILYLKAKRNHTSNKGIKRLKFQDANNTWRKYMKNV